jgi:hypothetical protein
MEKTTVYLQAEDYQRLKAIARREERVPAELVREAVREYVERHGPGRRAPRSLGAGKSGSGDLSECAEEHLRGMGEAE